jgi:hypothetical protein
LIGRSVSAEQASPVICPVASTPSVPGARAAHNAVKESRRVPGASGPHTCASGYEWREAFGGDDVCVTGATRSRTAADNAAASARYDKP